MEAVLRFTVTNQEIVRTDDFVIVEGSENYLRAQFTFTTPDWDGLIKSGVFIDEDGEVHTSLCTDDICDVPPAWLKAQRGAVGVLGSDGTKRITTSAARVRIREKGYTGDGGLEEEAGGYFEQIMAAFADTQRETSEAAGRAENAEKSAEGWAHGHEDFPERAQDNAMYYADRAQKDAQEAAGSLAGAEKAAETASGAAAAADAAKEEAASLNTQAQTAAENALLSERNAAASEEAAEKSAAAAETAEGQAELSAQQAEENRNAAQQSETLIRTMGQEIVENRDAVAQMTDSFELLHQQAVADVNNAGQAQTERVEEAGESAASDIAGAKTQTLSEIQAEGTAQTEAVTATGNAQVSAVQTAGSTQVSAIQSEGDIQTARVQATAAEIVADREQIQENQITIQSLQEELAVSAPGIMRSASGTDMVLADGAGKPFAGMIIHGRTVQKTTEGKNLFDAGRLPGRTENGTILTNNGDGGFSITDSGEGAETAFSANYLYSTEESIKLFPAGTYKISADNINPYYYIQVVDADRIDDVYSNASCNNPFSAMTVTDEMVAAGNYRVRIGFYKAPGIPVTGGTVWPVVWKGTETPTVYEPYTGGKPSPNPEYPQELVSAGDKGNIEVEVTGKNLFNPNEIVACGIAGNGGQNFATNNRLSTLYIPVVGNDVYALSGYNYVLNGVHAYDENKAWIGMTSSEKPLPDKCRYVRISFKKNDDSEFTEEDFIAFKKLPIQYEKGKVSTEYEPYRPIQILTISTPNGLPGIPVDSGGNYTDENGQQWVCDEVDFGRGVYVQRVKRVDLKTVSWFLNNRLNNNGHYFTYMMPEVDAPMETSATVRQTMSNIATCKNPYTNVGDYIWAFRNNSYNYIRLGFADPEINTPDKALAYLQSLNDAYCMYTLLHPIETPIPAEELAAYHALHTNYPTTVITNDEECHMEAGYVADTETYISQNYVPKESYNALEQRVAALESQAVNNI